MKNLYILILVLTAVLMAACSNDDEIVSKQPANNDNVVTQTTTVAFETASGWESVGTTRALTDAGVKTFAVGDKIAVVYTNTSDVNDMVESAALTAADIAAGGRSAKFKVTMTNPKASTSVTYIYPAAMANADGTPKLTALDTQGGTLASLASNLDYAQFTGTLTSSATLPETALLANQLAVCKFTIMNSTGDTDITNTITKLTIIDGTNTYTINRIADANPIFVAMRPVNNANFSFTATGNYNYEKTVSSKTLAASDLYPINLAMNLNQTISHKEAEQTLTIPATGWYTIQAYGAEGGASTTDANGTGNSKLGGKGGFSSIDYQLTQGQTLYIYCGGKGGDASLGTNGGGAAGWNGGGKGGDGYNSSIGGGGGGGATHVATSQIGNITNSNSLFTGEASSPTAKSGLILVAAGGGGGAYKSCAAGTGGGASGGHGTNAQGKDSYSGGGTLSTGSHGGAGRDGTSNDASLTYSGSGGHGGGFTTVASLSDQYQSYGGFGGSSWGETSNGKSYATTAGGATDGGPGKVIITWYGTTHP